MGYIFEEEIASILNVVRTRTIGEEDEILLHEILAAPIPPSIKAYFRAEIEKTFLQERAKEIRSKKFSYSIPEVVSLQKQIDKLLILHYHFSRAEFETLLDESVHFQFNYLCRPQWTLLNFILGNQRHVSASTIEAKLTYCVDYSYFVYLIKRYIEFHGYTELKYEDFKSLLKKIDAEITAQHTPAELALMLRPLFLFLETTLPQQTAERTIPINAAIVFFDDKHLSDIRERLEIERDVKGLLHISMPQLIDILQSLREPKAEADNFQAPEFKEIPLSELNEAPQEFEEQSTSATVQQESSLSVIPENTTETHSEENILQKQDNSDATITLSLASLFPQQTQNKIIRKLFHKDEREFLAVLSEIEQISHWEDVAHYLDTLYVMKNIDPFSEVAVLFTDTLYDYFQKRTSFS